MVRSPSLSSWPPMMISGPGEPFLNRLDIRSTGLLVLVQAYARGSHIRGDPGDRKVGAVMRPPDATLTIDRDPAGLAPDLGEMHGTSLYGGLRVHAGFQGLDDPGGEHRTGNA